MCMELEKWSKDERDEGKVEGESRLLRLMRYLKAGGRKADMDRALEDESFRQKLYAEYHLG